MEACQSLSKSSIVQSQTAEASQPGKSAFDDPPARQQDKALFGFLQFDDQQVDAVLLSLLRRRLAGVSLIDKGDLHRLPSGFLDLPTQLADLGSLLLVGWSDGHRQQMSQGVHSHMDFRASLAF